MNKLNEEILAKFLMGECTEDELREVNAWLEGSGENARELFRLEEIYHLGRLGDTSNTQDIEKAEKRLFKRLEQEKTKQYKVRRMVGWMRYAAVFVGFFLLGTFGYLFYQTYSQPETLLAVTTHDKIKELKLPDGTKVWLNSESTLSYRSDFGRRDRDVELDGEAYFEVARNEKCPFVVRTHAMDIEVLGTKFNVEAYSKKAVFEASLMQGKIRVKSPHNEKTAVVLLPNYKTTLKDGRLVVSKIDDYNVYRWKEGLYCFKSKPFTQIMEDLERYYDLKIQVDKKSIESVALTGKFRISDGLDYALRVLQKDVSFTYRRDKDNDVIYIK